MPGFYIWTSQLKEAYVGTTPVKEIYVGTTKVRPNEIVQEFDFATWQHWFTQGWEWYKWYTSWTWFRQYAGANYWSYIQWPSSIYQWEKLKYIEMKINLPNAKHGVWVKYDNSYWIRYNSDPNTYKVWWQNKYDTSVWNMTWDMILTINFDSNTTVHWTINWQNYTITNQALVEWLQNNWRNHNFYFVIDSWRDTSQAWIKKIKIISA